jgi:hypothetical protein
MIATYKLACNVIIKLPTDKKKRIRGSFLAPALDVILGL